MGKTIRSIASVSMASLLFATGGMAQAEPMEAVFDLDVENPAALMSALNTLFESDDMSDHTVTLWASQFDGSSPGNHVIVAEYDDYEEYETLTARRVGSPDWSSFVLSVQGVSDGTSSLMAVQRSIDGGGWRGHGALAAYILTVRDVGTYMDAFNEMIGAMDNPGSVRLMELRAGGDGATHAALISAPTFSELNNYIDGLYESDAFRTFIGKVSGIRTVNTVHIYRRVKSWGD